MIAPEPLLDIRGLTVSLDGRSLVDAVDFHVKPGEVLGIVGESGSGKSLTLRAITRLLSPEFAIEGHVRWKEQDLLSLPAREMTRIRGKQIAMIFQEPMRALNPLISVGRQITESLAVHLDMHGAVARTRAAELLDLVGIVEARRRLDDLPHEFSGGMRQRVMIAIALAAEPALLLADEPTTALDMTIQDQVLRLLLKLKDELSMSIVLVTHDLGVVLRVSDRVAVFYAGKIVESGAIAHVLGRPAHAYTLGLKRASPDFANYRQPLTPIPGLPPQPDAMPSGCRFFPRCRFATTECATAEPPLIPVSQDHLVACLNTGAVQAAGGAHG